MSELDEQTQKAIAAFKAGRKDEARDLFLDIVDQDEHNEEGWLWLSALVDTLEEQQICLENVLAINPNNERARKGLETVNQKMLAKGSGTGAPAQPSGSSASAPPSFQRSSSMPIGAEFSEAPGDSLIGGKPAASTGFGSGQQSTWDPDEAFGSWTEPPSVPSTPEKPPAAKDTTAPSTSVEWGREGAPVAYGSGKQVELPSEQEYDAWVQGLNIGADFNGAAPAEAKPAPDSGSLFAPEDEGPFSDTSFMVESDAFGAAKDSGAGVSSAFGADAFPWSSGNAGGSADRFGSPALGAADESPFGPIDDVSSDAYVHDDFPSDSAFGSALPFDSGPAFVEDDDRSDDLVFDFDADDDGDELLWPGEVGTTAQPSSSPPVLAAAMSTVPAGDQAYYQYIPADIQAKASSGGRLVWLVGVLVLIAANMVSFAYLFASL